MISLKTPYSACIDDFTSEVEYRLGYFLPPKLNINQILFQEIGKTIISDDKSAFCTISLFVPETIPKDFILLEHISTGLSASK